MADLKKIDEIIRKADENTFIHFSSTKQLGGKISSWITGDNPTPPAIYAYPVLDTVNKYGKNFSNWPYASDYEYIFVLNISSSAKILDMEKATKEDLKNFLDRLLRTQYFTKDKLFEMKKILKFKYNIPGEIIWKIPYYLVLVGQKKGNYWTKLLIEGGYDVVVDRKGIIHPNEPIQAAILNPDVISSYEILGNPYALTSNKNTVTLETLFDVFRSILVSDSIEKNAFRLLTDYMYSYYNSLPYFDLTYEEVEKNIREKFENALTACEKLEKILEVVPSEILEKHILPKIKGISEEEKNRIRDKYSSCPDFERIESYL